MTSSLGPLSLPALDVDWTDFVDSYVEDGIARSRDLIARIKDGTPRVALEVLGLWNQSETAIGNVGSLVWPMAEVHPDADLRKVSEKHAQDVTGYLTEVGQDRDLFDVFAALSDEGLDADYGRLLERTLRDFRRSGVDRDDEVRDRLKAIDDRLTILSQEFSRGVRDDVRRRARGTGPRVRRRP